jgi:RHS repeat-associated protein
MAMPSRQYTAGSGYRYGFNGKENDNDVKGVGNQQDYGMRIYDPRVGRFLSVDPLTKDFAELTPYQFASNTPVKATDIDGLESSWVPPGQTIRYDQIRSRPDALNQTATVQLKAQQQQQISVINHRTQAAALSKPKSVLSATDTSPGANMRKEGFRQQAAMAKNVGQAMQTPEGQAGMGLAGAMYSAAETPVRIADRGYGIYEGIQDRNGWQIAGNSLGLALELSPFLMKGAKVSGSGPAAGVIEVSSNVKSVKAFLNYDPVGSVEFVFDASANTFLVGKPKLNLGGSPHQQLVKAGGMESNNVVGGMFKRGQNGEILTNEYSGHYHQNWTPELRKKFQSFLEERTKAKVNHTPGM